MNGHPPYAKPWEEVETTKALGAVLGVNPKGEPHGGRIVDRFVQAGDFGTGGRLVCTAFEPVAATAGDFGAVDVDVRLGTLEHLAPGTGAGSAWGVGACY